MDTKNDKELDRGCPGLSAGVQQTGYRTLWSTSCKLGAAVHLRGQLPPAPWCEWQGSGTGGWPNSRMQPLLAENQGGGGEALCMREMVLAPEPVILKFKKKIFF